MRGSIPFTGWLLSVAAWLLMTMSGLFPESNNFRLFFLQLQVIFQGVFPGFFLLFVLQFVGRHRWFDSGRQFLLFVFPAIVFIFGLVYPGTDILWKDLTFTTTRPAEFHYGWLYAVLWGYVTINIVLSLFFLDTFSKNEGIVYQKQIRWILVSSVFPILSLLINFIFSGSLWVKVINSTIFSLWGILIAYGLYRHRLFDLPSVTYYSLLDNFREGVVVLDPNQHILFINKTAASLLEVDLQKSIGEPLIKMISSDSIWYRVLTDTQASEEPFDLDQTRYYEVEYVYLPVNNEIWHQKMITIRDITQSHRSEQAEKEARGIAEIRAMELDLLRIIAEKLNRIANFDQVKQAGLEEIVSRVGARFGYVVLANQNGRPYLAGSVKLPYLVEQAFNKYVYCPSCKVFEKFMSGEYQEPVSFLPCLVLDKYSISYPGLISIPLRLADHQIGVLNLVMAPDAVFSGDEIRLVQTIGDQYSAAIERARLYEEAEKMATLDPLTGLYNRRYFFETAQEEFDRACRYKHHISIIMLDIDLFKNVNDTYGHLVGDQVLQIIADRCKSVLRSSDKIGRYGGEEFVILLPETTLEKAEKTANRIRSLVGERPILVDQAKISATVSVGVSSMNANCELNLEQVLEQADQALYQAKQRGRNRVHVWNDPYIRHGLFKDQE